MKTIDFDTTIDFLIEATNVKWAWTDGGMRTRTPSFVAPEVLQALAKPFIPEGWELTSLQVKTLPMWFYDLIPKEE